MATDPFSWARSFGDQQAQVAENSRARAQSVLMNLFQEEAARQRPYATMPAELARAEFNRRNELPYTIAAENRRLQNEVQQRRYYNDLALQLAKDKAAAGLAPTYTGAVPNGMAPGSTMNADGSTTVMIGGKPFVIPAAPASGDE